MQLHTRGVKGGYGVRNMLAAGVDQFYEVGPGKVLRGLLKALAPGARALGVDDADSLTATLAALGAVPAGGVA